MSWDGKRLFLGVFAICAFFRGGLARELKFEVPKAVLKGHDVLLKCWFDLEGDKIYSVKWYHNSAEFYRYTLNGIHSVKPFNLKGFHIVEEKSNATQVVLKHVTRAINGQFSCEVTEDQPSFYTEMRTASLEVVDPPLSDPIITGTKSRYKVGEYIKAICSTDKSDPAVNLTWHINGRPIDGPHVRKYRKTIEGNYISSYSTLQFGITDQLVDEGRLKIRCTANIHDIWQRTVERHIELQRAKQIEDDDFIPAWKQITTTTSTEFSHEKYWLFVARDTPDTTHWSGNGTSSSNPMFFNKAMIVLTMIVYVR